MVEGGRHRAACSNDSEFGVLPLTVLGVSSIADLESRDGVGVSDLFRGSMSLIRANLLTFLRFWATKEVIN